LRETAQKPNPSTKFSGPSTFSQVSAYSFRTCCNFCD